MLEIDPDLVVAVDVSRNLVVMKRIGCKLIVLRNQADAHAAVVGVYISFQSQGQKLKAVLLLALLKNDIASLLVDEFITRKSSHFRPGALPIHH